MDGVVYHKVCSYYTNILVWLCVLQVRWQHEEDQEECNSCKQRFSAMGRRKVCRSFLLNDEFCSLFIVHTAIYFFNKITCQF